MLTDRITELTIDIFKLVIRLRKVQQLAFPFLTILCSPVAPAVLCEPLEPSSLHVYCRAEQPQTSFFRKLFAFQHGKTGNRHVLFLQV